MTDPGELFRLTAEQAAEYRRTIGERPQRPMQSYSEAAAAWEAPTPETGEAESKVIAELIRLAGPGLHAMTGPRFYGWVIGGSHPVGAHRRRDHPGLACREMKTGSRRTPFPA